MEILMAVLAGIIFMAATYLLLSKSLLRVIIGTALLSHGVHLMLFDYGRIKERRRSDFERACQIICRSASASPDFDRNCHFFWRYVIHPRHGLSRLSGIEIGRYGSNEGK